MIIALESIFEDYLKCLLMIKDVTLLIDALFKSRLYLLGYK